MTATAVGADGMARRGDHHELDAFVRARRRRRATVALVTVAVVTGVVALALQLSGDVGRDAEPVKQTVTHTAPALPEGAIQGVVDVSAPTPDNVFRVTVNVGCVGCSTIWRRDLDADGGWERLHDFTAPSGDSRGLAGIQRIAMAPDGEVGYAWASRLFLTEDGGRTWTRVIRGPRAPRPIDLDVHLTEDRAWSQEARLEPTTLDRSLIRSGRMVGSRSPRRGLRTLHNKGPGLRAPAESRASDSTRCNIRGRQDLGRCNSSMPHGHEPGACTGSRLRAMRVLRRSEPGCRVPLDGRVGLASLWSLGSQARTVRFRTRR